MLNELAQLQLATKLIKLGARPQLVAVETSINKTRLLKLYKDINGVSAPKGQLPFSADWYIPWENNIHASLFLNFYICFNNKLGFTRINSMINAYCMYVEMCQEDNHIVLPFMRAWTLVRLYENRVLCFLNCTKCHGFFINHNYHAPKKFICSLCAPPSRVKKL